MALEKWLKFSNTFAKMSKHGRILCLLVLCALPLFGCLSNLWTGANLLYDRHGVYKKLNDYQLSIDVNNALFADKLFKCDQCMLDLAVFHGDVLIAGHLPSDALLEEVRMRLYPVRGYRHLYTEIKVEQRESNTIKDSWITAKIRSRVFADDSIDPNTFKIVTSDQIVYLMGEIKTDQGRRVIAISRHTNGVLQVVKLFKYVTYQ